MNEKREYTVDGVTLQIPLRYDAQSGKYIEDYGEWIFDTVYTPSGHPILFSGTDSCSHGEEATGGGCSDCGSCKFYKRAARHTWIGVCVHRKNRKEIIHALKEVT